VYADQCQDQAMKSLLFDIARNKRRHANEIKQLLGQRPEGSMGRQFQ
jgi:rubrerythrin